MKLTIITITLNNADGLCRTMQSVFSQTCQDFEYIVIDGASTDGSRELIEKNANRIDYWVSEPDKGIYNAMNKGIDQAHGEYCLFLNSGDTLHDSKVLEDVIPLLDGTVVITGSIINGTELSKSKGDVTFRRMFLCSIPHPSSFIRLDWMKRYKYDESLKIVSDWKFFFQVLIMDNQSHKFIDRTISDFDLSGISSTNLELNKTERETVKREFFSRKLLAELKELYSNTEGLEYLFGEHKNFYSKWLQIPSKMRHPFRTIIKRLF